MTVRAGLALAALAGLAAVAAPVRAEGPPPPPVWLGIGFEDLGGMGARVTEVHPGTAAAAAGLRPGDEIVAIDGRMLSPAVGLPELVSHRAIGARLPITFFRDGRRFRVTPRLTVRPPIEEIVHQRFIDRALPVVPLFDRHGAPVAGAEWTGRPQVWMVFDVRCEPCAAAATALGARMTETAGDGPPGAPLRVVLIGGREETASFLSRVPVLAATWRVDRDDPDDRAPVGRRFTTGLEPAGDGVVLVVDHQGVVRFATAISSGEAAHDGACAAARRAVRAWRH